MDKIRLATPEEVSGIAATSDLGPSTTVWAFENTASGEPDLAVIRQAVELDPVYYRGSNTRKAAFVFGLETAMRMMGVPAYYFNVPASEDMAAYRSIVQKWGAEPTSPTPEIRYKKVL